MELKEYIAETLVQISAGIEAAQNECRDCGGFINPAHIVSSKGSAESHFGVLPSGQNIFLVDFDVVITVVEESGSDASGKLKVCGVIDIGGSVEQSNISSATKKVSFKVPMALPVDAVSEDILKKKMRKLVKGVRCKEEPWRIIVKIGSVGLYKKHTIFTKKVA